jgi:hypothetical protein
MFHRYVLAIASLATGTSIALAGTFTVTVKVVDADKNAVAKADVATFWNVKDGAMKPSEDKSLATVTDADGRAVLRIEDWGRKRAVLVLSPDRKLGGMVGVSKANDGKEVSVTLRPTVRVKGTLMCKELNFKPAWANTIVTLSGFGGYFAQDITKSATLDFVLPAGTYTLSSYGGDVVGTKQTITLAADRLEHDCGTIDLKASPIAKLRGKTAPDWFIADARGVKADVKLADYKGKWVYIEFWGFW